MSQAIWVVVETIRGEITDLSYAMLGAGREIADGVETELIAVVAGVDAESPATLLGVADTVHYLKHVELEHWNPEAHQLAVTAVLKDAEPRLILCGHTTMGMDLGGYVATKLGLPLVASCQTVSLAEGRVHFASLTCGGKLVADGLLPEPASVITMIPGGHKPDAGKRDGAPTVIHTVEPAGLDTLRTHFRGYIEPDASDVDVAKEDVLVSVGRGIHGEENLALARQLADTLGGVVAASRPVVDAGWLPTTRLIGKSGKTVGPRLYLAVGISGAPEHLEGVGDCGLLVAINTDEKAPIFDVADYGATVDALELLPALKEQIERLVEV